MSGYSNSNIRSCAYKALLSVSLTDTAIASENDASCREISEQKVATVNCKHQRYGRSYRGRDINAARKRCNLCDYRKRYERVGACDDKRQQEIDANLDKERPVHHASLRAELR